ncbi:MAG: hypothetical protein HC842_00335 [Cytophagales bacterium]|nr:hypothetical protein [Cytophagales bacterium]
MQRRFLLDAFITWGAVDAYPLGGERFNIVNMNLSGHWLLDPFFSVLAGFDFMYNASFYHEAAKDGVEALPVGLGTFVGFQFDLGRLLIHAQLAAYLIKAQPLDSYFYQRYGIKYLLGAAHLCAL